MKHIYLISALMDWHNYSMQPIAAGETPELATQAFEQERSKYTGMPVNFDVNKMVRIPCLMRNAEQQDEADFAEGAAENSTNHQAQEAAPPCAAENNRSAVMK